MYFALLYHKSLNSTIVNELFFIPMVFVQVVVLVLLDFNRFKKFYPLTDRPTLFIVSIWCHFSIFLSSVFYVKCMFVSAAFRWRINVFITRERGAVHADSQFPTYLDGKQCSLALIRLAWYKKTINKIRQVDLNG